MRCPKCSYLSYEEVERCRNCGYDFAFAVPPDAAEAPTLDLPGAPRTWEAHASRTPRAPTDLMAPEDEGLAVDLPLFDVSDPSASTAALDALDPRDVPTARMPHPPRSHARAEPVDPPMPIPPVAPPLVVRRTVDVSRTPAPAASARSAPRTRDTAPPALDFDEPGDAFTADDFATPPEGTGWVADPLSTEQRAEQADDGESVGGRRALAGLVDACLLVGIDALVVWLTLRLLGLDLRDWGRLPLAPLCGFLFLLDTSYLVTFTAASGQSLGKMLTGLRVVPEGGGRVPFGHAVVRSVVLLLCALPAGLGLVPVFLDTQGRGLHDRVAGTRVIASR